jgi:hypothetical protein
LAAARQEKNCPRKREWKEEEIEEEIARETRERTARG